MAKERLISIPQTKSDFSLVGKVVGVKSDKFYTDIISKKGNPWRKIGFSVEYEKDKRVYVELNGSPKDKVYFGKKSEVAGQKGVSKAVPWANRTSFNEEGFVMMGVACGLEKDEATKKNKSVVLSEFDACEYIANHLTELGDDTVVRVIGEIDHSHWSAQDGNVLTASKFLIKRIYLSGSKIDDDSEAEKKSHYFHQSMVVKEIEKDSDNQRFEINGYVINYKSVESVTVYSKNAKLANNLIKTLKSNKDNIGITLYGQIEAVASVDEVVEEDDWGEVDVSKVTTNPFVKELYAVGADKETLELEEFKQSLIEQAIEKIKIDEQANDQFHGSAIKEIVLESADMETEDLFSEGWD